MTNFIKQLEIERAAKVKRLQGMAEKELKSKIRQSLQNVEEADFKPVMAKYFIEQDADEWLKLSPPAKASFDAIAHYLAEGGQL